MTDVAAKVVETSVKKESETGCGESVDPDNRIGETDGGIARESGNGEVDPDERVPEQASSANEVDDGEADAEDSDKDQRSQDLNKDESANAAERAEAETSGVQDSVAKADGEVKDEKPDQKKTDAEKNRMEPPVVIKFKCPAGVDPKEFERQLKGQERGLNSQTIAENVRNRETYEARKAETGNGRDPEGTKAQEVARQKAYQSRIESNQKKGMSYAEAKAEAETWIKGQAALHNPDQIAGGDPTKVSRMGDANVNSSIGSQWRSRVDDLKKAIDAYSEGKTSEELANTKLNVKLVMEEK